ncbi:hypothetical protein XI02_36890 [Bradyrhizobium sp. CCBAU 21365]|nr:hypothetical protein XI02_36890 [Bradyrhizobium sp. CCBAU 21365]
MGSLGLSNADVEPGASIELGRVRRNARQPLQQIGLITLRLGLRFWHSLLATVLAALILLSFEIVFLGHVAPSQPAGPDPDGGGRQALSCACGLPALGPAPWKRTADL